MMDAPKKRAPHITIEDVCFYFDGVARDRFDSAGTSRRSGEVLALRDSLMRLPEAEFEVVMRTLRRVVTDVGDERSPGNESPQRAKTLYDSVRMPASSSSKGAAKVSRT
ncbi:MAG: hypothetical protein FJ146_11280 [Deltaproteobacteria bacterium]|nr:hypothetical protein [Deltaproteobacteria bacterium]